MGKRAAARWPFFVVQHSPLRCGDVEIMSCRQLGVTAQLGKEGEIEMGERFERHRQPWTSDEIQKLHTLAKKGMALKAIAKALTRSEESVRDRAKADGLKIARLR